MTDKKQEEKVTAQQPDGEQVELNVFAGVSFVVDDGGRLGTRMVYNNVSPEHIMLAGKLLTTLATRMMNDAWSAQQMRDAQQKAQRDQILVSIAGSKIERRA